MLQLLQLGTEMLNTVLNTVVCNHKQDTMQKSHAYMLPNLDH